VGSLPGLLAPIVQLQLAVVIIVVIVSFFLCALAIAGMDLPPPWVKV
jgi:hypothetical protein